jgi:hypothetical protein
MEVAGKVVVRKETEEVGGNGFTKRTLVIETEGQYPKKLAIDFVKDKTALLDPIQIGQEVKVQINLSSNESKGKWFSQIQGWKIE